MSSGETVYDESGALASYFGISFLSLVLFPTTLVLLKRSVTSGPKKGKECSCADCQKKVKALKAGERGLNLFSIRNLLLLAGWAAFFALAYTISQEEPGSLKIYDPFEILGISSSSDEKAIKKHYKRISLKYHPDKIRSSDNQTKEEAEAYYVELTKAYKSLTDDTIRENLRKFGNPDGQQPREDKIAIPKWIVEGNNGFWILALYGLGLGGGIPFVVGRWWFRQRVLTKDGALSSTAEMFFHNLKENISFPALLALLASASELKLILSAGSKGSKKVKRAKQSQTEALEKRIKGECERLGLGDVLSAGWEGGNGKGVVLPNPSNRRAVSLLWSHLLRVDDLESELLEERRKILLQVPKVMPSLINVAVAYHWLDTTTACMNMYAQLVQAAPSIDFPTMQLPSVDVEKAKTLLMKGVLGDDWQAKIEGDRELSELVGSEGLRVAKEIPRLHITDAKFEVEGENSITVGSLCQFNYTVHLTAPEPSIDAIQSSKKNANATTKDEKEEVYAHAPRWPAHRKPHWWVVVADATTNTVLFPPQRIGDIPLLSSSAKADGSSAKGKTFKLSFPAPPSPGSTTLEVYYISDTYPGVIPSKSMVLTVANPEEEAVEDDGDISEPDIDSIAGQIAMLKGQKVRNADEEHDDDSDSDADTSDSEDDTPRKGNRDSDSDSDSD